MLEGTKRRIKVLVLDDAPAKRTYIKQSLGKAEREVEWIEAGSVNEALDKLLGVRDIDSMLNSFQTSKFSQLHDVDLFFLDWDMSGSSITCPFPNFQGFGVALVADPLFSRLEHGETPIIVSYSARSYDIGNAPEAAFLVMVLSSRERRNMSETIAFEFLSGVPQKYEVRECFKAKTEQLLALLPPSELFTLADKIESARSADLSKMPLAYCVHFTTGEMMDVGGLFTYMATENDFETSLELVHTALLSNTFLGNYKWYLYVFDILVHASPEALAKPNWAGWDEFLRRNAERKFRDAADQHLVEQVECLVRNAKSSHNGILTPLECSSPHDTSIELHRLARGALMQDDKNWGIFDELEQKFGNVVLRPDEPSCLRFYVTRKYFLDALTSLSGQISNSTTEVTVECRLSDRKVQMPELHTRMQIGDCGIWFKLRKGFFRRDEMWAMGSGGWGAVVAHIKRFGEIMCFFSDKNGDCMWDMLNKRDVSARLGKHEPYSSHLDEEDFLCIRIPGIAPLSPR